MLCFLCFSYFYLIGKTSWLIFFFKKYWLLNFMHNSLKKAILLFKNWGICFTHIPWHSQILKINLLLHMYLSFCFLFLLWFLLIPLIMSSLGYFYILGHTLFHWNIAGLQEIILLNKTDLPTFSGFHLSIRCDISCTTPCLFWDLILLDLAWRLCNITDVSGRYCFLKFHLLPEPLHFFYLLGNYDMWNFEGGLWYTYSIYSWVV